MEVYVGIAGVLSPLFTPLMFNIWVSQNVAMDPEDLKRRRDRSRLCRVKGKGWSR